MLTNKNFGGLQVAGCQCSTPNFQTSTCCASYVQRVFGLLGLVGCLLILGCSPPGPRALLEGKRLLDEGKYPEAVESLKRATVLLPKNALAPNYLGLAYHAAQQPEEAIKAYRMALALDHKLAAVRYNLGCLYLEQENTAAAIEELRSFTLLQPGAVDGWLKQGSALARARRFDEAERSYRMALDIHARHPEALNGLGLIQMQRRRFQEALNHFNAAAVQEPPYPPAVFNSAIVQQQLGNRQVALQRYRQFLSLRPRSGESAAVEMTVRQLELELNPQPLVARAVQPAVVPALKPTNAAPVQLASSRVTPAIPPSLTLVSPRSNSSPAVVTASPAIRVPVVSAGGAGEKGSKGEKEPGRKGAGELGIGVQSSTSNLQPSTFNVAPEVSQVHPEPVIRPAQELVRPTPPLPDNGAGEAQLRQGTNSARRGFFSRLNPFGGKGRTNSAVVESTSVRAPALAASSRYSYLSPAAPTAGDAVESEKAFKRGVKAQRAGNISLAIAEYQAAVKADPANYDAYYNLGLAALERGDARFSLWAYEIALALKPSGEDARYNFGLALKAGGYWQDAAEQFQKLIVENPSDARAHLSLANLCAQQLQQASLARDHYQRVLEINPKHAEAAKIRYWLAANP